MKKFQSENKEFKNGVLFSGNNKQKEEFINLIVKENANIELKSFHFSTNNGRLYLINLIKCLYKNNNISKANLLIHEDKLYVNRIYPIFYEKKDIEMIQVPDVINFNKKILSELYNINISIKIINYYKYYDDKDLIELWDKYKFTKLRWLNNLINKKLKYNNFKIKKKINILFQFMKSCHILGIEIHKLIFNESTVKNIYKKANELGMNYVKGVKKYISYFNEDNSNEFENEFYKDPNKPVLEKLQSICSKYNYAQYSHTECVLEYRTFKNFNDITNCIKKKTISFISYFDMCLYCEDRWAKIANEELHVNVVSFKNYIENDNNTESRKRKRKNNNNKHLVMLYENFF